MYKIILNKVFSNININISKAYYNIKDWNLKKVN